DADCRPTLLDVDDNRRVLAIVGRANISDPGAPEVRDFGQPKLAHLPMPDVVVEEPEQYAEQGHRGGGLQPMRESAAQPGEQMTVSLADPDRGERDGDLTSRTVGVGRIRVLCTPRRRIPRRTRATNAVDVSAHPPSLPRLVGTCRQRAIQPGGASERWAWRHG